MPVLESPRWIQWPLAHLGPEPVGHCFLFRLDPLACVASLEDEEATHAASFIPRDWFLGILLTIGNRPMYDPDGVAFLHFRLGLIGTGLPEYEPASVPIAPSPQRTADRPPLVLEPALPWKDLYLHTDYYLLAAFVSRLHYTPGQPVATLDPAVLQKVHRYRFDDEVAHQDRLVEKERSEQEALQANIERERQLAGSEQAPASSSISSFSGSGSEIVDIKYMLAEEMQTKFSRARFFIEVWLLDPASHPEPATDPAKLAQATAQVEEIWKAWQERMLDETLAKRPQTNEWLRGVEDSGPDEPKEWERDADSKAVFEDDDILPEDAVDARIEKALAEHLNQSQRPLSSSTQETKVPLNVREPIRKTSLRP